MSRIFTMLAGLNLAGLLATFLVGLLSMSRDSLNRPQEDSTYFIHFHLGLYTGILNLAVHSMVFIYFLGTGRWVKEVALAYQIPDVPLPKLTRDLKRWTFPAALIAMLVPIATSAAGLGVQMREWPWFLHGSLAILTIAINLWAYRVEYRNISTNAGVIADVLREVDRIRAERGLPSNEEALRQEQELGERGV